MVTLLNSNALLVLQVLILKGIRVIRMIRMDSLIGSCIEADCGQSQSLES